MDQNQNCILVTCKVDNSVVELSFGKGRVQTIAYEGTVRA